MRTLNKYNITYDVIYPSSDNNNNHYGLGAGMISVYSVNNVIIGDSTSNVVIHVRIRFRLDTFIFFKIGWSLIGPWSCLWGRSFSVNKVFRPCRQQPW